MTNPNDSPYPDGSWEKQYYEQGQIEREEGKISKRESIGKHQKEYDEGWKNVK